MWNHSPLEFSNMSSYDKYYGGVIWTNHALSRMEERGLDQSTAFSVFKHPQIQGKGSNNSFKYEKKFDNSKVTIVAKQNKKGEWLILSAWIDPPLPGSKDALEKEKYKKYQKVTGFKRFLLAFMRQLGF